MLTEYVIMSSSGVFHCFKNPSLDHASHYALHCSVSKQSKLIRVHDVPVSVLQVVGFS